MKITDNPNLSKHELQTIYQSVLRAQEARKNKALELKDLFGEKPRLAISPSNKCSGECLHCVANSVYDSKEVMNYDKFREIDPEFLSIFNSADFGRRGDPKSYSYLDKTMLNKDICDVIEFLNRNGIKNVSIASAIQEKSSEVSDKLAYFVLKTNSSISTMLTYHHYFDGLDMNELVENFNITLKDCLKYSDKIVISLLGDVFDYRKKVMDKQGENTMATQVKNSFYGKWKEIFSGINITKKENEKEYSIEYENKKARMIIPKIDTRVYPLGRFRKYLADKGVLADYKNEFEKSLGRYACPDLIKWPGIILEPNGDLNLCASFEAINCKKGVVSNILEKDYELVKKDLFDFHEKELDWFVDNLEEIVTGNVQMCKVKNNGYESKY